MSRWWLLICLTVASGAVGQTGPCAAGSAEERLACLRAQRCPALMDQRAEAACYRDIALALLQQTGLPVESFETGTMHALEQRVESVQPGATPAGAEQSSAPAAAPDPAEINPVAVGEPVEMHELPNAVLVTPAPAASDTTDVARQRFGLEWEQIARADYDEVDEIRARIVAARKQPRGTYLFNLDNGQLWQQNEKRRLSLATGDEIRITRMTLRSYKLFPASGPAVRVSRIACEGADADPRCGSLTDG